MASSKARNELAEMRKRFGDREIRSKFGRLSDRNNLVEPEENRWFGRSESSDVGTKQVQMKAIYKMKTVKIIGL
jgi:hypothetical protein